MNWNTGQSKRERQLVLKKRPIASLHLTGKVLGNDFMETVRAAAAMVAQVPVDNMGPAVRDTATVSIFSDSTTNPTDTQTGDSGINPKERPDITVEQSAADTRQTNISHAKSPRV